MTRSQASVLVAAICIGLIALTARCSTSSQTAGQPSPQAASAWSKPAVPSVSAASKMVGGFSAADAARYKAGLDHIRNTHGAIGDFTIAQVIGDEQTRENQRQSQRQADQERDAMRRANAQSAGLVAKETADVQDMLKITSQNAAMAAMIKSFSIDGKRLTFTIDADIWNPLSDQDKTLAKQALFTGWSGIYNRRHGTPGQAGAELFLNDLTGNQIDSYY